MFFKPTLTTFNWFWITFKFPHGKLNWWIIVNGYPELILKDTWMWPDQLTLSLLISITVNLSWFRPFSLMYNACTFSMLHFFHDAHFPRCALFMLHFFHVALFSCCTFFMLHYFHVALFSCYTLSMLHFFHVAYFPCCTFSMLHSFHVGLFSCCTLFMLHFPHAALSPCCTFFMLQSFHVRRVTRNFSGQGCFLGIRAPW